MTTFPSLGRASFAVSWTRIDAADADDTTIRFDSLYQQEHNKYLPRNHSVSVALPRVVHRHRTNSIHFSRVDKNKFQSSIFSTFPDICYLEKTRDGASNVQDIKCTSSGRRRRTMRKLTRESCASGRSASTRGVCVKYSFLELLVRELILEQLSWVTTLSHNSTQRHLLVFTLVTGWVDGRLNVSSDRTLIAVEN